MAVKGFFFANIAYFGQKMPVVLQTHMVLTPGELI